MLKKHISFLVLSSPAAVYIKHSTLAPVSLRPRLLKAQSALIGQLTHA